MTLLPKPVPTPPHFETVCVAPGHTDRSARLDTTRDLVFPAREPFTYVCGDHRAEHGQRPEDVEPDVVALRFEEA